MSEKIENSKPPTRAELVEAYGEIQEAVKALHDHGGPNLDNLTTEQAEDLQALLDDRDDIKALLDTMPDPCGIKARVEQGTTFTQSRTARPAITGDYPAPEADVKADNRIDAVKSEHEKYLEKGEFKSFGHYLYAVRDHAIGMKSGRGFNREISAWQDKLKSSDNAVKALYGDTKATGLNEYADSEGGVLAPLQFAAGIWTRSLDNDFNILSLMNPIPTTGNTVKVRARQDKSRVDGSRDGGVLAYWSGEASQYTKVKPTYRTIDLRLEKLTLLIPATEELLEDSTAAEAEISDVAARELRFKCNDAFFRGNGTGMPLGLLNSPAKVTVAGTGNGANNTVTAINVDNMWMQRAKPSGQGYVWLANQAIEGQLQRMFYTGTTANTYGATFAYVPGSAFNGDGLPNLKGKPVYYNEFCEDLGTEGDLILFDPAQYAVAVKANGITQQTSIHFLFDTGEVLFKFYMRMDARPYWEAPLTRYKGANTLSPILTLNANRA